VNNWIQISWKNGPVILPKLDQCPPLPLQKGPWVKAGQQEGASDIAVLFCRHNEVIPVNKVHDIMLNGIECFQRDWRTGVLALRSICPIIIGNKQIQIE